MLCILSITFQYDSINMVNFILVGTTCKGFFFGNQYYFSSEHLYSLTFGINV